MPVSSIREDWIKPALYLLKRMRWIKEEARILAVMIKPGFKVDKKGIK